MTTDATQNGWISLNNGFDVELQHGIPLRLSNNGLDIPADDAQLVDEVKAMSGLSVVIQSWQASDEPGEQEAKLCVDPLQFGEVLHRLALASAALFVDRYHTDRQGVSRLGQCRVCPRLQPCRRLLLYRSG